MAVLLSKNTVFTRSARPDRVGHHVVEPAGRLLQEHADRAVPPVGDGDVQPAVAVQVPERQAVRVCAGREVVVRGELAAGRLVEYRHISGVVRADRRDRDVRLPVAVDVSHGDAVGARSDRQGDHRAQDPRGALVEHAGVVREAVGDGDILAPVAVQVRHGDVVRHPAGGVGVHRREPAGPKVAGEVVQAECDVLLGAGAEVGGAVVDE
jgi:hypothetical protein